MKKKFDRVLENIKNPIGSKYRILWPCSVEGTLILSAEGTTLSSWQKVERLKDVHKNYRTKNRVLQ